MNPGKDGMEQLKSYLGDDFTYDYVDEDGNKVDIDAGKSFSLKKPLQKLSLIHI